MASESSDKKLLELLKTLELPESAYESAKRRYEDLGRWLERPESSVALNDPHVHVQGSFALGTAIRPLLEHEEYDLDLACKLRKGISRATHAQSQLKQIVGEELERYRQFRKIEEELEEKHRCWRLQYQDDLQFHLDVVPSIPAEDLRRAELSTLMEGAGVDRRLALDVAAEAVWITDDRKVGYRQVNPDWPASNPEGYVKWFVSRMEMRGPGLLAEARVDDIPVYRRKTNLQRCIQLLKRHRDRMFMNTTEMKPISIIITTLAAGAYKPGQSIAESMALILEGLMAFRRSNSDVVQNPVNPKENFADRWALPEGRKLNLKQNFHNWVDQAVADFRLILDSMDPALLSEQANTRLAVKASADAFSKIFGLAVASVSARAPARVAIEPAPPRPWAPRKA